MRRRMLSRWPVRSGRASCAASVGYVADRRDDVGVGGAPADVAAHPLGDLDIREGWRGRDVRGHMAWPTRLVFRQQRDRRADLTGRAIPALQSIVAHEGSLHRMQIAILCQTLNGCDL